MDHRKEQRVAASGHVLYSLGDVVLRDTLYNLSGEGCMIEADHGMADVGDEVEITLLQGVVVGGSVIWVKDGSFGVRFHRPIGEATVKYFRLTDWSQPSIDEPTDGFGRSLPPLNGEFRVRAAG